ncbi:MAG: hypothetical protein ABF812_09890 [Gluconobacter cerinus]|uniref:hypothetical protein n=1 Tax=Gluconobacter cerinus TaxID=38307 RepID=UPI0039EC11B3
MSGRTDTERLDWWELRCPDVTRGFGEGLPAWELCWGFRNPKFATGDNMRAAIDAAMDAEERG